MADTTAGLWPSRATAWWAVTVFTLAAVLSYTDRQILSLLVDPMRAELRISDTQVSLLQGLAFAIVYSFAGLPLGRLADLFRRRAVIIAGVLIWTCATVACGLAQSFSALFIARMFVGVGEAALAPAAMSMITDLFPAARRGTAIGVFLMGMLVGGGAALSIGGFLLQAAQDGMLQSVPWLGQVAPWRATLLLLGAPGVLVILLLLTLREPRRQRVADASARQAAPYRMAQVAGALLARRGLLGPLLAAMALMSVGDFSLLSWLPSVLARNYHFSAGHIGAWLGGVAVVTGAAATVVGGLASDMLSRRQGPSARIALSCLCAACTCPVLALGEMSAPWMVLTLFGWWNFFSSAAGTSGITALQEAVPNETRGLAAAMISFCNILLGLGLGTMCTALVTDRIFHDPLRVALALAWVVGPACVAGALCFGLAWRKAKLSAA